MGKVIQTVKGMRDLLPDDLAKIEHIESLFLKTAGQYGFGRVQTPTLESAETYKSTSEFSEERCYSLVDGKGRKLILRSDPDAPLARLVAAHFRYAPKPVKLAFCGSIFRSWNPRRREFRMFSINTFGVDKPTADAEILRVIADVVEAVGFPGYRIEFNNLELFRRIIAANKAESHSDDYVGKILYGMRFASDPASVAMVLNSHHLSRDVIDAVLSLLECHDDESKALDVLVKLSAAFPSLIPEMEKIMAFRQELAHQGIKRARLNVTNLHGTGFYSGLTYRLLPESGPREIGDGGRYDHMMQQMHCEPIPATGIGLGIERFLELMALNQCPAIARPKPLGIVVAYTEPSLAVYCQPVLRRLRLAGLIIENDLINRGLDKTVRYAESKHYNRVVLVAMFGPDEWLHLKIINLDENRSDLLVAYSLEELFDILLKC